MEKILAFCRWDTNDFKEMNFRLFDSQENNYAFWDSAERDVLDQYWERCMQLKDSLHLFSLTDDMKQNFQLNWSNLITALNFIEELRNRYEPLPLVSNTGVIQDHTIEKCRGIQDQPRYYDERPIKAAIRANKVIYQWGSCMNYLEKVLPALCSVSRDMQNCSQLQNNQEVSTMSVSEYLKRRQEPTMYALLLKDFAHAGKLILLQD